jgi:hypothetical protein
MKMETRVIDETLFFVTRNGKREVIQTSAEVATEANTAIAQAGAAIATLSREAADLQSQIEAAILAYESTVDLRAQLDAVQAAINEQRRNVSEAEQRTLHVRHAVTAQHAQQIAGQHHAHTAAALAEFDTAQLSKDLNALLRT